MKLLQQLTDIVRGRAGRPDPDEPWFPLADRFSGGALMVAIFGMNRIRMAKVEFSAEGTPTIRAMKEVEVNASTPEKGALLQFKNDKDERGRVIPITHCLIGLTKMNVRVHRMKGEHPVSEREKAEKLVRESTGSIVLGKGRGFSMDASRRYYSIQNPEFDSQLVFDFKAEEIARAVAAVSAADMKVAGIRCTYISFLRTLMRGGYGDFRRGDFFLTGLQSCLMMLCGTDGQWQAASASSVAKFNPESFLDRLASPDAVSSPDDAEAQTRVTTRPVYAVSFDAETPYDLAGAATRALPGVQVDVRSENEFITLIAD